ncbi:MAG: tetratricopeptide repeat protein [Promethearchaeota archaeon]
MHEVDLELKKLLNDSQKYIFIAGAGCSINSPSNFPASKEIIEEIIKFTCAESEIETISKLEGLRFETILEIIRNQFDKDLKIIEYFEQCNKPNNIHFFLAEMINKGHIVITTNFDYLIEHALIQLNDGKDHIFAVITEKDYREFKNIFEYLNKGKKFLFKIHGSMKDILTERNTKEYFHSLIKKIGSYKSEFDLFFVEPNKGILLNKLLNNAILILLGYSGQNDFDIIPILKKYHKLKRILWVNHVANDQGYDNNILEIEKKSEKPSIKMDDLDKILFQIKNQNPNVELFRLNTNSIDFVKNFTDNKYDLDPVEFSIAFRDWLHQNFEIPNMMMKFLIPHVLYFNFDRLDDSFRCGIRALEYINENDDQNHKLLILNNIAWFYYRMGNYSEAILNFEESLKISQELGYKDREVIYLSNLGEINEKIKNLPKALQRYKEAMKILEETGNLTEELRIINSVIEIYEEMQIYTEALLFSDKAIKISEKLGDLKKKAIISNNIASIHYKLENLNLSLEYFQQSEKIFRRLNDIRNLAICLNNIGTIYQKFGDFSIALEKFEEVLEYDERLKNKEGKAWHLSKVGEVYFDQKNYRSALKYFTNAIKISQELKDFRIEMKLHNLIGKSYYFLRDYPNAMNSFNSGKKIAEMFNDLATKADFLNNIAGCYFMQLNYKMALKSSEESLLILKLIGMGKSIKAITLENKIMNMKNQIKS